MDGDVVIEGRLEFELSGDLWDKAPEALRLSARRVEHWQQRTLALFMTDLHHRFQNTITGRGTQLDIRFRQLSPYYVKQKQEAGLGARPLLAVEAYAQAIELRAVNPDSYAIVVAKGEHPDARLSFAELANILEHGTRNMEPLPHWRPMTRRAKKRARQIFGSMPSGTISFR